MDAAWKYRLSDQMVSRGHLLSGTEIRGSRILGRQDQTVSTRELGGIVHVYFMIAASVSLLISEDVRVGSKYITKMIAQ